MKNPYLAIRASAGSGKTFQLTSRMLALLLDGVPTDEILAATFTRKAAGEILERLLLRLAEAARDKEHAAELAKQLGRCGLTPDDALELLASLTARIHTLRIGTLDSLFARVAAALGFDLGLPSRWDVLEDRDDDRLRARAVAQMLDRHRVGDLHALFRLLTKGETARSVERQLREAVDDMHRLFVETRSEVERWTRLAPPARLPGAELTAAVAALYDTPIPPNNKPWQNAHAQCRVSVEAQDWLGLLQNGLVQKIAAGAEEYARKPIPPAVAADFAPLIRHARAAVLGDLAAQTKATFDLLRHFDDEYGNLKDAAGALRFEDVARRLADAVSGAVELERLDAAQYMGVLARHLLLDEFQDTAPVQWRVLAPLAEEIVSHAEDHSFFCVGDPKQAIYGWRGGSAELFDRLQDSLPNLVWDEMEESRRSAPPIVEFVNRVFGDLTENATVARDETFVAAATAWSAHFRPHSTVHTYAPGFIHAEAATEAGAGERNKETAYRRAAELIRDLHAAAPHVSVGVLLRKNSGVARMMEELRAASVPASQEGGNPASDATAVQLILALLRLADFPDHQVARFFVAHSPLGASVGLAPTSDRSAAYSVAADVRRRLIDFGYGPTVADWAAALDPHVGEREAVRLWQVVDLAYDFDAEATLRPSDFAEFVLRQPVEDPSAAAVRVMTVHQAKGLEFDAVFLPELDEDLLGQPPSVIAWSEAPAGETFGVLRYASKEVQEHLPDDLRLRFRERAVRTVRESYCLLYVALTRAAHALYIVTAPSKPNEKTIPKTFAGILRSALGADGPLPPNQVWYSAGNPAWPLGVKPANKP